MEHRHYVASLHPVASKLRPARIAAGLTLAAVAAVVGKNRCWLCRKELGWRRVKSAEYAAILKAIAELAAKNVGKAKRLSAETVAR